jgi:chromosome partitioning protein
MGDATAAETIQETGGVTIIPGARGLSSMDMILGPKANREYRLKEALSAIVDDYDYILIDTPPSLGVLTINALTAAYGVIIPACAEVYGLQGIAQLYSSILEVRKYPNPNLNVMGILLTRIRQTRLMKDMETLAANVADEIGTVLYKTRIRETTVLKEAQAVQKTIFCYAPSSYGARDYSDFTQEFLLQSKKERKNVKK